MNREIEKDLLEWKKDPRRRPLLVRGARQVGKSYTIAKFGRENFQKVIIVDFELQPSYKKCFEEKDPEEVIKKVSIVSGMDITPGDSLLFLDEIQACPAAIESLRYFFEKMPDLHVIGAGSLLEFALEDEGFTMPVGRVSFLYMYPLSFREYLDVIGEGKAGRAMQESSPAAPLPEMIHTHLLKLLKYYLLLGGMPAVVDEYLQSRQMQKCRAMQSDIIESYRSDFGKYASRAQTAYLEKVFIAVAVQAGKKFKYAAVDPTIKTIFLKNAVSLLEKAGIVHKIRMSSGAGIPIGANAREKGYKAIFFDVGLMQNICGLDVDILQAEDLHTVNAGAVTEQFVGQELLAYGNRRKKGALFFWERTAKNSSAEIDYLVSKGSTVMPVEVKSGKTGRLKSLNMFMENYHITTGYKISQEPWESAKNVTIIPLYAVSKLFE